MAETQAKADKAVAEAEEKARQAVAAAQPKAFARGTRDPASPGAAGGREGQGRGGEAPAPRGRARGVSPQALSRVLCGEGRTGSEAEQAAKAAKAEPERAAGREAAHEDVDRLIRDLDRILDEADKADAKAKPDGLDALVPIDYLKQPDEKRRGEPKKADKAPVRAKPKAADGVRSVAIGSGDDRMDWEIPE